MFIGENFIGEGTGIIIDNSEIVEARSSFPETLSFTSEMSLSFTSHMGLQTFESDLL